MSFRPIAIYLPQFHPIPENDEWWGTGFTEWRNVTRGRPLFKGHYQPHLPADLGFYDLRLQEIREQQVKMAGEHGIYGFCYYHYWFNGKRLLNSPIDDMLETNVPDFPFMLCWANENWTRSWDGKERDILLKQEYSETDDEEHMDWLCRNVFNHKNYITVEEKPVFVIYRYALFPDIKRTTETWRKIAVRNGFKGLYLIFAENSKWASINPEEIGFDASMEFQPYLSHIPRFKENLLKRLFRKVTRYKISLEEKIIPITTYNKVVNAMMAKERPNYKQYPGIMPGWDNTSRRPDGQAFVIHDSTPEAYGKWLKHIAGSFTPYSTDENFIFINAWNEWAEGNHLEPCLKWGKRYLQETKKVLINER